MFEYYNDILCVEGGWLFGEGEIVTKTNYDALTRRGWFKVERRACKGTPSLVAYSSIPERFKKVIVNRFGDPHKATKHNQFKNNVQPDGEAMTFYSSFKLADGRNLPEEAIREYCANASILNALHTIVNNRTAKRKALGGSVRGVWEKMAQTVEQLKDEFPHTLPSNSRRLKDRYNKYRKEGYLSLIHKGYCNDNSRKVSASMENLILSLYAMPNKPYSSSVHDIYLQFLGGAIEVVDFSTGELFDRNDFIDKNGMPVVVSESTIWNYINDPKNRVIVDNSRNDAHEFNNIHRPHHHRHAPQFSLSKISMDDRDIPHKMQDGNRVKAYYAYDVTSGCVIGASYSRLKDKALFIDCMRDMFRNIYRYGFGMPMEVEVEHHLVNQYKDDFMKAGIVFPFVRWCNPGNSQEKRAEHFNRAKKYGYEKKYQQGIGRFYSKLEANRPKQGKVFDEHNNNYKYKTYSYEQLVADDLFTIEKYNNDLHPKQKLYKGMTRLDVMKHHLNPNLATIDKALLARYIGDKTETSIRRSQYLQVQYAKYQLPSPEVLSQLEPNNYNVDAYYIPEPNGGNIPEVYIYQDGVFVAECEKIATYNESTAEQTSKDRDAYTDQTKYVSEFDKLAKDGKKSLGKVVIMENEKKVEEVKVETVDVTPNMYVPDDEFNEDDFFNTGNAINDL